MLERHAMQSRDAAPPFTPSPPARSGVHWHCRVDRELALDVLDVRAAVERTWHFAWPGKVVVQSLSAGVTAAFADERYIDERATSTGISLVAPPQAAVLRVHAVPGSAFRVLFEHVAPPRSLEYRRTPSSGLFEHQPDPIESFRAAVASSESSSATRRRLPRRIALARAFIETHLHEDFDLATLSNVVGIERCRLCRLFHKAVGLPPQRFRVHLRVARARTLLAHGVDCSEVAHTIGFCDQSHLNRWFKALTGTTPAAYANACRIIDARRPSTAA